MHDPIMTVGFCKDTGKILSIGPGPDESENGIHLPFSQVKMLKDGSASKFDYRVEYDLELKNYVLKKVKDTIARTVNDLIYEIKTVEDSDITVVQNKSLNKWTVTIDPVLQKTLKENKFRTTETLNFSITELGDPNILYRYFTVSVSDLLERDSVDVEFTMPFETQDIQLSIYTTKVFNTYSYEVVDEI